MTLAEVLIGLAMTSVLMTVTVSAMERVFQDNQRFTTARQLELVRDELYNHLLIPKEVFDVLRHPANQPSASCLENETTDCPTGWQPMKLFQVRRDAMGEILDYNEVPYTHDPTGGASRGFTQFGASCVGYDPAGRQSCPFRYRLEWRANCNAPCRDPNSLAVRATLEYSPAPEQRVPLNLEARSVLVSHPLPRKFVERISIGQIDRNVCAMFSDGTAKCWGANYAGNLGANLPLGTDSPLPVYVKGFDGVRKLRGIASLNNSSDGTRCALMKSKRVVCWGENQTGMAGIGVLGAPEGGSGSSYYTHPVDFVQNTNGDGPLENVEEVFNGGEHSVCAQVAGEIYCWGNYSWEASHCAVNQSASRSNYYHLSRQPDFTSAGGIVQNPQLFTSLPNRLRNIDPADPESVIPQLQVMGVRFDSSGCSYPTGWHRFFKGPATSCFLVGDPARAVCWGEATEGALGNSSLAAGWTVGPHRDMYLPAVGFQHQRLLPSEKPAFGEQPGGPNEVPPLLGIIDIEHTARGLMCALLQSGEAVCMGNQQSAWFTGGHHMLGNGDTSDLDFQRPAYVIDSTGAPGSRLSGIKKLSSGSFHSCALKNTGEVYCWGGNDFGGLGPGVAVGTHSAIPILVPLPGSAMQVEIGMGFSCALIENGRVFCWGANWNGQAGVAPGTLAPYVGNSSTPREVGGLDL